MPMFGHGSCGEFVYLPPIYLHTWDISSLGKSTLIHAYRSKVYHVCSLDMSFRPWYVGTCTAWEEDLGDMIATVGFGIPSLMAEGDIGS